MFRKKLMREIHYSVIFFFLLVSSVIHASSEWRFATTTSNARLPELYINFEKLGKLGLSFKKGDVLYLRIVGEKGYANVPTWDRQFLTSKSLLHQPEDFSIQAYFVERKTPWRKVISKIYVPKIRKIYRGIMGQSYRKFTRELKVFVGTKSKSIIIGFPVKKDLNSSDRLRIARLPIIFNGATRAKIQLSKNKKDWIPLDYVITVGNCEFNLYKEYHFIASDTLDYSIGFSIRLPDPSIIKSELPIRFIIPATVSVMWSERNDSISVVSKNGEEIKGEIKRISDKIIEWTPQENVAKNTIITFTNAKVRGARTEDSIHLNLEVAYTDSEGGGNFRPDWQVVSTSQNGIRLVSPYFKIKGGINYTIFNETSEFQLPSLVIGQGNVAFFQHQMEFELTFPENIPVEWDLAKIMEINRQIKVESISTSKSLSFVVMSGQLTGHEYEISNLFLKRLTVSVRPFRIRITIRILDQNEDLTLRQFIQIGQPQLYVANRQLILTAAQLPAIERLIIAEDEFVSTINPGDKIIYSLPKESKLRFNKSLLSNVQVPENVFRIAREESDEHNLVLEVIRSPGIGYRDYIRNIPLNPSRMSIPPTYGKFTVQSSMGSEFVIIDSMPVEIARISIDMASNAEFIRDVDKDIQRFHLPDIIIENDGFSPVLKGEDIILSLNEVKSYLFKRDDLTIESTSGGQPVTILGGNEKLTLRFKINITPGERVYINGLIIELPKDHKYLTNIPILAIIGSESNRLYSDSTLTYGAPVLRSAMEQVLIHRSNRTAFYSLELNFGNLSKRLNSIDEIILRLPNKPSLRWSENINITFSGTASESLLRTYELRDDAKTLVIPVNENSRFSSLRKQVYINGLGCQEIVSHESGIIRIRLSIDGGKTIVAMDEEPKRIVSQANAAAIDRQRVFENWYPFKKGNKVKISLQKSPSFIWDTTRTTLRYSKRDIKFNRTKIFDNNLLFSEDLKTVTLTIRHDVDDESVKSLYPGIIYQMMDFGQEITLEGFVFHGPSEAEPVVNVVLQTLYGELIYPKQDDFIKCMVEYLTDTVRISLGLHSFPVGDKLNNPSLISWYRYPEKYLPYVWLTTDTDLEQIPLMKKKEDLSDLKKELEKHYRFAKDDIDYDWVFWYYLSWYKKRIQELKHTDFNSWDFPDDKLNGAFYKDDFIKSEKVGYEKSFAGQFPDPIGDKSDLQARKIAYEKATELFNKRSYLEAEYILLENLFKPGMEDWIRVAYWTKLGQIGEVLMDTTVLYGDKTYSSYMYGQANSTLNSPDVTTLLMHWKPQIKQYLDTRQKGQEMVIKELGKPSPELKKYYEEFLDHKDRKKRGPSKVIEVSWDPKKLADRNEWEFLLSGAVSYQSGDGEYYIDLENRSRSLHAFGNEIQVYGGNIYSLDFDPPKNSVRKVILSVISGILFYTWVQL